MKKTNVTRNQYVQSDYEKSFLLVNSLSENGKLLHKKRKLRHRGSKTTRYSMSEMGDLMAAFEKDIKEGSKNE